MKVNSILFDTRSIQKYIFSGNELKTNIGASYIVEHLFEKELCEELLKVGSFGLTSVDTTSWEKVNAKDSLKELPADAYVAYIGGGNALILFKNLSVESLKQLVGAFTKTILLKYPGLRTGAAIGEIDLDYFSEGLGLLYKQLKQNQQNISPFVDLPSTGLTVPCQESGKVGNYFNNTKEDKAFISEEVFVKEMMAVEANSALHEAFSNELRGHSFPMAFDELGQKKGMLGQDAGTNDYAIVHIDGNNMGRQFSNCKTLSERTQLSANLKAHSKLAFQKLVSSIVSEYEQYEAKGMKLKHEQMPLRPLILGGDDVTFVCNAQMALDYARRFMEYMDTSFKEDGGITIKTCAGIAILPTKYPFFRGCELAEQLCGTAKALSRKEDSCWLDYAILHGEQAPTVEQIREQEYTGVLGNMHFGPYRVDGSPKEGEAHLQLLLESARRFNHFAEVKGDLARNKVKGLRFLLEGREAPMEEFKVQFKHMRQELPLVEEWSQYKQSYWSEGAERKTPLVDVIEVMEYVLEMGASK